MPRPTKCEIMRERREVRACNIHYAAALAAESAPAVAPAVPTMEIDGLLYRESPELPEEQREGLGNCYGCAFDNNIDRCVTAGKDSAAAFGGDCRTRPVIYISAE